MTDNQRTTCVICGTSVRDEIKGDDIFISVRCPVRAFGREKFHVWRCPNCKTITCLEIVDLSAYYAKYPFADAQMTLPIWVCYNQLYRSAKKHGLTRESLFLDYGCGGQALFVQFLRRMGYTKSFGYDPYSECSEFASPDTLSKGPFDFILCQDVIEHVEDPVGLLRDLNRLLAPGGILYIGTPNAAQIDLTTPESPASYDPLHVPYHLHIYTADTLEMLGADQGFDLIGFSDRAYGDTPIFGINSRAANEYQTLCDGSLDVLFDINYRKALSSFRVLFYSMFGYWLSHKTEMTLVFRKSRHTELGEK